jgi:hypothetical protein
MQAAPAAADRAIARCAAWHVGPRDVVARRHPCRLALAALIPSSRFLLFLLFGARS